MGNSASCFDPVREHPPYSWPKDHPERDNAIAERKRLRKNRKSQPVPQSVEKESAKDVTSSTDTNQQTKSLPTSNNIESTTTPSNDVASKQLPSQVTQPKDATNIKSNKDLPSSPQKAIKDTSDIHAVSNNTDVDKISEMKQQIQSKHDIQESIDEQKEKIDTLPTKTSGLISPVDDIDGKLDDEDEIEPNESPIKKVDETIPVTTIPTEIEKDEDNLFKDAASTEPISPLKEIDEDDKILPIEEIEEKDDIIEPVAISKVTEDAVALSPAELFSEPKAIDNNTTSFDTTRAMFDSAVDDLPEADDLSRDVLDPVTNEHITLSEYRERQAERAQGMVKEHVDKFEEIDDQVSKQRAELAAIDAARAEVANKAEWRFKSDPTMSPIKMPMKTPTGSGKSPTPVSLHADNIGTQEDDDVIEPVVIEDIPAIKDMGESDTIEATTTPTKEATKTTIVEPAILPTS